MDMLKIFTLENEGVKVLSGFFLSFLDKRLIIALKYSKEEFNFFLQTAVK